MSDTPRTDAVSVPSPLAMERHYIAMRDLAMQLERECAILREALSRPINVTVSEPLDDL